MAPNGKSFGEKVLDRIAELWQNTVIETTKEKPAAEPKPLVTAEDKREQAIKPWARQAPPEFYSWLAEQIYQTRLQRRDAVDKHGSLASLTGFEDALTLLESQFKRWTSREAPAQGE